MHRHVRHLRLACAREDHARHGRVLLEDALRTASFGDEGRLVLIRKLDVGQISLRASATQWSQRIEHSYRRLQPIAVSVDSSGADRAAAVYFANIYEPWLRLATRIAAGEPCIEWYWRPALPGWAPGQSAAETLRLAFRMLVAQGGLGLTLLLARRLRSLAPLLQALQGGDFGALRRELTLDSGRSQAANPDAPPDSRASAAMPRFNSALDATEAAIAASWPAGDVRLYWLAAAHLARDSHVRRSVSPALGVATAEIHALVRHWNAQGLTPAPSRIAERPTNPTVPAAPRPAPEAANPTEQTPEPTAADRTFTRAAGLFFVVPLLVRAGFPEFITTLPSEQRAAYPWHVLRLILQHALRDRGRVDLRAPRQAKAGPATSPRHTRVAADDHLANDPLVIALADLPQPPSNLGRWLTAANRQALRLTGLNLRQIVLRPAPVSWSVTHTDVFFRPGDADIRIRRAGLDVDPGWVPWLNCVIHFHYNRES